MIVAVGFNNTSIRRTFYVGYEDHVVLYLNVVSCYLRYSNREDLQASLHALRAVSERSAPAPTGQTYSPSQRAQACRCLDSQRTVSLFPSLGACTLYR